VALEALFKTERFDATRQFVARIPRVAADLGIDGVDATFADRMYDARSDWVHGSHVRLFASGTDRQPDATTDTDSAPTNEERRVLEDVARLQDVLRAVVRRCIQEPGFRGIFEDDDAIRDRWPVPAIRRER
jgi:hypothetical protein